MPDPQWDIRREGRRWSTDEMMERLEAAPEKLEVTEGKLYWDDEERLTMLAMLLENVGIDAAVRLGDPQLWRDAIAELDDTAGE